MITQSQQQVLDELKETFSSINSFDYEPTDIFAMIDKEKNGHTAKKMRREAAITAAEAIAKEKMDKYFDEFITPVLNRYFPSWRDKSGHSDYMEVTRTKRGRLVIKSSYDKFEIEPFHRDTTAVDGVKGVEFVGFYLTNYFGKVPFDKDHATEDLGDFDEVFATWIVERVKSNIGYY